MIARLFTFPLIVAMSAFAPSLTAEDGPEFFFDTGETEWSGERITLPPGFAPDMNWIGEEDIRFAPGMFTADADDFFSYALVFALEKDADVTKKNIEAELLTYYRGLASAVMKGKQMDVDTGPFKIALAKTDAAESSPAEATDVTQYNGTLTWVEPFATQKAQKLHMEVQCWMQGEQPVLFFCVSPKGRDDELWKKLREIRASFRIDF